MGKKFLIVFLFIFALCGVCCTAQENPWQIGIESYDTNQVSLEVQAEPGSFISVLVMNPGKKPEDIGKTDSYLDVVQYEEQLTADMKGNASRTFTLRPVSNIAEEPFTVFIKMDGAEYSGNFYYFFADQREGCIKEINEASSGSAALGDKIIKIFGMNDFIPYSKISNKAGAVDKLISIRGKNGSYTVENTARLVQEFKQAIILCAIYEKIDGIYDEGQKLADYALMGIESLGEPARLYQEKIRKDGLALMNGVMAETDYQDIEAYYDEFSKQSIYHAMMYSTTNGYGHINEILADSSISALLEENGFSKSDYNKSDQTKVASELLRVKPGDFETMIDKLNQLSRENPRGGIKGPGGGTGSGSTGGSGTSTWQPPSAAGVLPPGGTPQPQEQTDQDVFHDLGSVPWAKDAVYALYQLGAVNGKEEHIFAPEDTVTREEFTKMLVGALELTDENAACEFKDVEKGRWSYPYIAAGFEKGIVTGIEEGLFAPGEQITNEQMAVMCYRAAKSMGKVFGSENVLDFADEQDISDYAREAVTALHIEKIVNGDENNAFRPREYSTRAQAAKVIYGILKL